MSAPLSEQQLDDIRGREAAATSGPWELCEDDGDTFRQPAWEVLTGTDQLVARFRHWARPDAEFAVHARSDVPALLAEVEQQQVAFDRDLGQIIDERDRMHDVADRLAYAVAPIEIIGEHSSHNDPWANALDLITPAADVERLRSELAERDARIAELEAALAGVDNRKRDRAAALLPPDQPVPYVLTERAAGGESS